MTAFATLFPTRINAAQSPEPALTATQVAEMIDSLRELKATVRDLSAHLQEMDAAKSRSEDQVQRLRQELERATGRIQALESPAKVMSSATATYAPSSIAGNYAPPSVADPETTQAPVSVALRGASQDESLDERLARLEENSELLNGKIADQYQTKVESGAKYRLRLSGIFLFNLFGTAGTVNNQDFPTLATEPRDLQSTHSFGGALRQSQLGLEGFGPDFAGARTSANLRFDFAGNTVREGNGALMGQVRLRTGTFRMDWANTSLVAGQDALFFVPLTPSSLASLAVPPLSYSGNLWGWTPQVRLEHRIHIAENSELHFAVGLLDQITGTIPDAGQDRSASQGEQSGQPAYAAHLAWSRKTLVGNLSLGAGGYYGRQSWGFDRGVDSWAATIDLRLPVTRYLEFTSAYYRGRAVGGFGGGIAQSALFTGLQDLRSSVVRGLDSQGGWAQLTLKARPDLRINAAVGQDNPSASQLRAFPVVPSDYGEALLKNQSWFVNGIYQLRSNILLSLEFGRLATHDLGADGYFANNVNFSLGYLF